MLKNGGGVNCFVFFVIALEIIIRLNSISSDGVKTRYQNEILLPFIMQRPT